VSASRLSIDCDGGTGGQVIADPRDNPFPDALYPPGVGGIIGTVGGLRLERWAPSRQNPGRHQIGIGGRLTSESAEAGSGIGLAFAPGHFILGGMVQSSELERAKARIRALAEKTVRNGCTDAEAFSAAEMVGRLLDRYMLTMDEVQLRASTCIQSAVPMAGKRRGPIDGCVPAIARFCHCIVWVEDSEGAPPSPAPPYQLVKRYVYFGLEADVQMATYLHTIVGQAIQSGTQDFRQSQSQLKGERLRLATRSFQHGLVTRLAERLDTLQEARGAEFRSATSQGTALVVAKQTMVADAFRETKIRLSARSAAKIVIDQGAFAAGEQAGNGINLKRPIEDRSPGLLG
jgi:hypothetical protein